MYYNTMKNQYTKEYIMKILEEIKNYATTCGDKTAIHSGGEYMSFKQLYMY